MKIPDNERRCNLHLWLGDGQLAWHDGLGNPDLEVSIGRTDSQLGLGFVVGDAQFVLDQAQVENLAHFLSWQARRMKKSGRRRGVLNMATLSMPSSEMIMQRARGRFGRKPPTAEGAKAPP
jgi:hypothetical protein